jgi:serine/threonine-protein kinase
MASASPAPAAAIPPQFSTRLRGRPGERVGPPPDPGIERDAQGGLVRVGKYRIVRKMGSGSAGEVFEGIDTQMSRRVAIKAMTRSAQLHFDHALERFVVEAKAAGSLNHPNINTIYDFGTLGNVSFMVLEYLDGVTLSQWMRAHSPPLPEAVSEWIRQISSALDYAHEHRVIHRDLKPSNLMVVDEGHTIKLLDFGVAKLEDVMLTQTGMTVGTPSYMSPEQLQGEKVTAASDQYSLAVVLYQLLTHKLPYAGTRIPEICNRILKHEIIPLLEANPALPEAYGLALERAMRKDPAERYPNCLALAEAFDRAGAVPDAPPVAGQSEG